MNNILQKKALNILKENKLRLTKQRVSLVENIYYNGDRHITAASLYKQMVKEGIKISLATVYNTLHFLTKVGLMLLLIIIFTMSQIIHLLIFQNIKLIF